MTSLKTSLVAITLALLPVHIAQAQGIVGAWSFGNATSPGSTGTGVLVFMDNGVYFHAESDNTADAQNGQNGMERGTYTWNPGTDVFTSATIIDTNLQWGLSPDSPAAITVSGDTMTIDGMPLTRVTGGSPIVGAWTLGDTPNPGPSGAAVIVFLGNGTYFHAESENTADAINGTAGMERGTYTWNMVTGVFSSTIAVDTNNQWGLNPDSPSIITVSGNSLNIDSATLTRVTAVPEPSTYAAIGGCFVLGLALVRRRRA